MLQFAVLQFRAVPCVFLIDIAPKSDVQGFSNVGPGTPPALMVTDRL